MSKQSSSNRTEDKSANGGEAHECDNAADNDVVDYCNSRGNTSRKHSDGNEALEDEVFEHLLKGQRQSQQQKISHVNFTKQQPPKNHLEKMKQQADKSDCEMTTYSPHKIQLKHQKSGFQLDGKSSDRLYNTTTMNNSTVEQTVGGVDETNGDPKTFTDANSKTTITVTSPSLNPTSHRHPEEYKGPKIWRNFVRNWPIISQPLAVLVIFLLLWMMVYSLSPDYAAPDTTIMRIAFLFVGAQISGILVTFIHLPDMLGMLFFGVLYVNLGFADFTGYIELEAFLRNLALINIMLLAGFGLDGSAFKKLWVIILRLSLMPTIAEVAVICILAHYLLLMPWFWGLLLGLVITAVSPNVVVTVMLKLKEEKLGLNKGIHTLIYGMTTSNDVVSIFTFGVILGVIFNQGKFSDQVLQGPVGIVVGIVFGYIFGLLLVYLPSKHSKYVNGLGFTMTVLGGCVSVMGSRAMGYPSAGALGCVTVAFVAGTLWRKQEHNNEYKSVTDRLDLMWKFLKPVSFSLIGKEISFAVLDGKIVGYGLIVIIVGCVLRLGMAYLSTAGAQLTPKERGYITISGFPKATVQAALGPIALDLARHLKSSPEIVSLASNVLIISVIAIIFTAPLGAILMIRLAPRWLKRGDDAEMEADGIITTPGQSLDNIAIISVEDNRIVMDSAHTNNGFDHAKQ